MGTCPFFFFTGHRSHYYPSLSMPAVGDRREGACGEGLRSAINFLEARSQPEDAKQQSHPLMFRA